MVTPSNGHPKRHGGSTSQRGHGKARRGGPGRPSDYTPDIADRIARELADGRSMRQICDPPDMPDRETVRRWSEQHPGFAAGCARARAWWAMMESDQMRDIEQQALKGEIDPRAASVVLSSMQWRLSKLNRALFGDKVQIDQRSVDVSVQPDLGAMMSNPAIADKVGELADLLLADQSDPEPQHRLIGSG